MGQPRGFVDPNYPNHVCKLHKALYGLKQAPRAWRARFSQFVISRGFKVCQTETSLFVRYDKNSFTILLVYVDDILLTGNDKTFITHHSTISLFTFSVRHVQRGSPQTVFGH